MKLSVLLGGAMTVVGALSAWKCENCGNRIHNDESSPACHLCGWPRAQGWLSWSCPMCDAKNSGNFDICPGCGLNIRRPGGVKTKIWEPAAEAISRQNYPDKTTLTLSRSSSEDELARLGELKRSYERQEALYKHHHELRETARNVQRMVCEPEDVDMVNAEFAHRRFPWRLVLAGNETNDYTHEGFPLTNPPMDDGDFYSCGFNHFDCDDNDFYGCGFNNSHGADRDFYGCFDHFGCPR